MIAKGLKRKPVSSAADAQSMELLMDAFGISPGDKFNISGVSDFMSVHVEKRDGRVITQRFRTNGNFRQMMVYNKGDVDPSERREIIVDLDADRLSQSAIADILGISQATVSLDLQKAKAAKKAKAKAQIEAPKKKTIIVKPKLTLKK
ncbi:hypothetical protein [Rhizobium sp. WYJ-E13]|uniref:hypothetical protein n=1 Tax=Rhizobium sp. WYJ-E13 TaxID=2849093 RepID=UPI001C1EB1F7|nr:hypothetical protein [Rhizobium sp. WYJ-E13]QWW71365.1 hypothetical protein KQ933_22175 [Rhizobium sp. WYJ-E13]